MKIGTTELLVIFIVALIVLGPDKLPYYAKKLGEALKQFKRYSSEAAKDIREGIVDPLNEAAKPLKEAMEPVTDLEKSVKGEMNDLKKSLNSIGKPSADEMKKTEEQAADETVPEEQAGPVQEEASQTAAAQEEAAPAQEETSQTAAQEQAEPVQQS